MFRGDGLGSCDQGSDEGTEEGFTAFAHIMNELEETKVAHLMHHQMGFLLADMA